MKRLRCGWTREALWSSLYALALGMAISVTLTLNYQTILSGPDENYLRIGLPVLWRGILFAVPCWGSVWLLNRGCSRLSFSGAAGARGKLSQVGFFLLCWGVLVLCGLPYALSYYPGGVVGDGAETLEYALVTDKIDSRWGVAQILVFRLFLAVGRLFSANMNDGIYLYAICSFLLYSAACAAVVTTLRKKGVPSVLQVAFVFLYGYCGHYASFGLSLWKDGLFAAGVTLFAMLLWDEPETPGGKWLAGTGAVTLFLCLWRNFVSYGLLAAGVLLLAFRKKRKKSLAILLIAIAVLSVVIQGPIYRRAGVEKGRISEALAIPIQQAAAVLAAGGEVSEEQEKILFRMLPREEWEKYSPTISDTVKHRVDDNYLRSHMGDFLKTWIQLLIRYPAICFKAYLMETLGFWQPYGSYQGFYYDWFLGVQDLYGRGYQTRDFLFEKTGKTMRSSLKDRMSFIPSGTMAWLLLLSLVLVLCRREGRGKALRVLLPFACCWMAVMGSAPIAYSYRYIEMLAMGFPLFVCVPLIHEGKEDTAGAEERRSVSGKGATAARIAAGIGAAVMILVNVTGVWDVYGYPDGRIEIRVCGERDNSEYFIREGLSTPEVGFRWTSGDRLTVQFPNKAGQDTLEVVMHVEGILGERQRYMVYDQSGAERALGEIGGPGEIRFELKPAGEEIGFSVKLPDAAVASEVLPGSKDSRTLALMISRIEVIRNGAK